MGLWLARCDKLAWESQGPCDKLASDDGDGDRHVWITPVRITGVLVLISVGDDDDVAD